VLSTAAAEAGPTVTVTGGSIRGSMLHDGGGSVFKGIPFAQPPVGDLRWREPLPVKPWGGVRDAADFGPPCAQAPVGWNDKFAAASREDCLYLDVWAPAWPLSSRKPVMLWIHGGGNTAGAGGSDPLYDGTALIRHDVVLVVIEYRLGIFGFLAHPEMTHESVYHVSGNYGILDQIAALGWVHDNIAKFGGDPDNVTIFGQSAGSIDALLLMTSPLSKGLFHRVIGESGTPASGGDVTLREAEEVGTRIAHKLKAPSTDVVPYLRSLSATELIKSLGDPLGINVDGWVFTASPSQIFASGKQHHLPLIIGSNAIEFPIPGSPDDLRKYLETEFKDLASRAHELYGLDKPGNSDKTDPVYGGLADQIGTDGLRCPVVIEGEWNSAAGNPTWEYQFDRAIPPRPKTGHSSDIPYVFGNLYREGSQGGEFQDADQKLSATIQTYWTNFARTGAPNGAGLPSWPKFDLKSRKYVEFTADGGVSTNENQRGLFCDLFREELKKKVTAQ
jgi:para-nitrobenzyl esterase